jgi:hypothetical protein
MVGKCVADLYNFCQEQVGWLKFSHRWKISMK